MGGVLVCFISVSLQHAVQYSVIESKASLSLSLSLSVVLIDSDKASGTADRRCPRTSIPPLPRLTIYKVYPGTHWILIRALDNAR